MGERRVVMFDMDTGIMGIIEIHGHTSGINEIICIGSIGWMTSKLFTRTAQDKLRL